MNNLSFLGFSAWRVWQRNWDVFMRLWRVELWPGFLEPVIILLAMGFGLGAFVQPIEGQSYLQFIAPGLVASSAMFSAAFECTYGSFVRMDFQKTYEAILATPLMVEDVITGEILWGATRSLFSGGVVLIVITAFGLVHSPAVLLILPLLFLEGLVFSSISLSFTGLAPTIYTFNYYFTLFITPLFFFSGIFFPLEQLPSIFQTLSWFAPLTHVVNLYRPLVSGHISLGLALDFAWLVVAAGIFLAFSQFVMRRRLIV
ncbi:MAG: ABC transporter permease [Dehalococcoidia bacterium]|nr:ABC transporter permease [Dehalococcoidia bacterium]